LRNIPFTQTTLDCGHGTKLCLIGELEKITQETPTSLFYQAPKQLTDFASSNYMMDYRSRCLVIPIIDNIEGKL